ncbi:hypothetical protein SGPA1_10915 [Streptomyces misionensis JCM 4497]
MRRLAARHDHVRVVRLGRMERGGEAEQEAQEEDGREPDGLGQGPGPGRPGRLGHRVAVPLCVVCHVLLPAPLTRGAATGGERAPIYL